MEKYNEYPKFAGSNDYKNKTRTLINKKEESNRLEYLKSYDELFDKLQIKDGMTLSFHHHLRNGDYVLNNVLEVIKKRNLKDLTIAASSIFPNNF